MSDNPQFWIQVVRTQAHVTDCREKTLALSNAAEAFARIFEDRRKRDESARLLVNALLTDKRELQADLDAAREEVARLGAENAALLRGEFICARCGIRKNAETSGNEEF